MTNVLVSPEISAQLDRWAIYISKFPGKVTAAQILNCAELPFNFFCFPRWNASCIHRKNSKNPNRKLGVISGKGTLQLVLFSQQIECSQQLVAFCARGRKSFAVLPQFAFLTSDLSHRCWTQAPRVPKTSTLNSFLTFFLLYLDLF